MNTNTNKDLAILKWVGVVLACLSTLFTLAIVSSHLSGRLAGFGKVGIIGTVGAELMAICCAWLVGSQRKRVAIVAMVCQVILTTVLLANASIALDLDWREKLAGKAAERELNAEKQAEEERRKTLEKRAELALQLVEKDRRLARAFVRAEKSPEIDAGLTRETVIFAPLDVRRLNVYERYGLSVMPLFLALLTVIALAIAAHSGNTGQKSLEPPELPDFSASVEMSPTAAAATLDAGAHSKKERKEIAETISVSLLPTGKRKSLIIGRYQFRKDTVGWRCREILGRGADRKRPYLAYLSRATYEAIQAQALSREEMEAKLVQWADNKREEKSQQDPVLLEGGRRLTGDSAKKLVISRISLGDIKSRK